MIVLLARPIGFHTDELAGHTQINIQVKPPDSENKIYFCAARDSFDRLPCKRASSLLHQ